MVSSRFFVKGHALRNQVDNAAKLENDVGPLSSPIVFAFLKKALR